MGLSRSITKLIALLLCTVALSSTQPEILSVSESGETIMLSRAGTDDWLHDYYCFFDKETRLACGEVTEVFPNRLEVTLFERGKTLVTQKLGNGSTALLRMKYLEPRIKSHHQVRLITRGQKKTDDDSAQSPERLPATPQKPMESAQISHLESEEPPFPGEPEPVKKAQKNTSEVSAEEAEGAKVSGSSEAAKKSEIALAQKEDASSASKQSNNETSPNREAASQSPSETLWSKTQVSDPTGSLGLGVNFIFPRAHYEQVLATHWTLGISAHLVNYPVESGPRLTGPAYGLSVNFYEAGKLSGLWVRIAGEFIELKSSGNAANRTAAPGVTGNVGWRWYFNSGINFGIAGGLNYIFLSKELRQEWKFNGAIPSILFDISFAF